MKHFSLTGFHPSCHPHFSPHPSYVYEKFADSCGLKKYHLSIREGNIAESLYFSIYSMDLLNFAVDWVWSVSIMMQTEENLWSHLTFTIFFNPWNWRFWVGIKFHDIFFFRMLSAVLSYFGIAHVKIFKSPCPLCFSGLSARERWENFHENHFYVRERAERFAVK